MDNNINERIDNPQREIEVDTMVTIEDIAEPVCECGEIATPGELSQENVMINPDPDSMESRG